MVGEAHQYEIPCQTLINHCHHPALEKERGTCENIEVSEKQLRSEIQLGETDPEGEIRGVWHLGKEREPFVSRRKLKVCKSLQKTIKHMMT